jgi:hypothetical protein
LAQVVEHHVAQVVQRFSQLDRVDQGPAAPVVAVKTLQIGAGDQKAGDTPAAASHPHPGQPAAHAQQKGASKKVCDL